MLQQIHPPAPPPSKKDKKYELKNIKMLLQTDSKYHTKIEKKIHSKNILTIPK